MKRILPSLLAVAFVLPLLPALAHAQTSVMVLGIRSVEGDDELAIALTGAIRHEASGVPGWSVSQEEISLAQMSLAHGCDEPDAACMAEIANELGAGRVIYGTVRRTGAGDQYDYALTLYSFNAEAGQIEDSLTDTIPRVQSDIDNLRPRADRYVSQFAGQARFGSVLVRANRPGAQVRIDGEAVGITNESGSLVVEDITEGQRRVLLELEGYDAVSGTVRVVADDQTEFTATLTASESPNLMWIPAVGLLGASVAFAIPWIINGLQIYETNRLANEVRDSDLETPYVDDFQELLRVVSRESPSMQGDVCEISGASGTIGEALGAAQDECDEQDAARLKAIVFGTLAGVTLAGGITMLLLYFAGQGDDDSSASSDRQFMLTPYADRRGGGFGATLTW